MSKVGGAVLALGYNIAISTHFYVLAVWLSVQDEHCAHNGM